MWHSAGGDSHGCIQFHREEAALTSSHTGDTHPQDWSKVLGETPPATGEAVGASELAAQLAGRLCHDLIAPASAIISGFDLLDDPSMGDMRADAMNLIRASAEKTVALVTFSRVAFGASNTAEDFASKDLHNLAEGVFRYLRAELDWAVELEVFSKPAARAILNLVQLGGDAAPIGGKVRATAHREGGEVLLSVEATSPRARLRPETLRGLHGEPLGEGLGGYWVQAYYLHTLLKAAGGGVDALAEEGRVILRARCPA